MKLDREYILISRNDYVKCTIFTLSSTYGNMRIWLLKQIRITSKTTHETSIENFVVTLCPLGH